jgi:hypothetical protein
MKKVNELCNGDEVVCPMCEVVRLRKCKKGLSWHGQDARTVCESKYEKKVCHVMGKMLGLSVNLKYVFM